MRWFRAKMRTGSLIALFALSMQLVVSYGHLHLVAIATEGTGVKAVAGFAGQSSTDVPDGRAAPPIPKPQDRSAGDFCAICSLTQLAGDVVAASSPLLPAPNALDGAPIDHGAQAALAPLQRGLFQARAPPPA